MLFSAFPITFERMLLDRARHGQKKADVFEANRATRVVGRRWRSRVPRNFGWHDARCSAGHLLGQSSLYSSREQARRTSSSRSTFATRHDRFGLHRRRPGMVRRNLRTNHSLDRANHCFCAIRRRNGTSETIAFEGSDGDVLLIRFFPQGSGFPFAHELSCRFGMAYSNRVEYD